MDYESDDDDRLLDDPEDAARDTVEIDQAGRPLADSGSAGKLSNSIMRMKS